MKDYIKSPLNYIGGKYSILNQIMPLFPKKIGTFLDLFAGGANVGVNIDAKKIILNDNLTYLMDLYQYILVNEKDIIINKVEEIIKKYQLSVSNKDGYNKLRQDYNLNKEPIKLLVLSFYSFNHQIRFNSKHEFNVPFGKDRSRYNKNIKENLLSFIDAFHNKKIAITSTNFDEYNFSSLKQGDFVYCDPPYLITTGTYNDGKRGFTGWNDTYEKKLLNILDELNKKKINFALSNVLYHKGLENNLLLDWIKNNGYNVHKIKKSYNNSNYHTIVKGDTKEVLITNY